MSVSSSQLISAIAHSLEHEVLTQLPPASWGASNVRSCLALLAYLQDRIPVEMQLLREDNADLRTLCSDALASTDLDTTRKTQLEAALVQHKGDHDALSIDTLRAANDSYRKCVEDLIANSSEKRSLTAESSPLSIRVRAYLLRAHEREYATIARSAMMAPF